MRGKPIDKQKLYEVFEANAEATLKELAKLTKLSEAALSKHRRVWISKQKPRPQLTVPHRYKESTVRLAVLGGFVVGAIFTITAAYVAGVL